MAARATQSNTQRLSFGAFRILRPFRSINALTALFDEPSRPFIGSATKMTAAGGLWGEWVSSQRVPNRLSAKHMPTVQLFPAASHGAGPIQVGKKHPPVGCRATRHRESSAIECPISTCPRALVVKRRANLAEAMSGDSECSDAYACHQ